jgi:uncharacterized membrane protein (UPF0127 family)/CheY-like chemotaxis protein
LARTAEAVHLINARPVKRAFAPARDRGASARKGLLTPVTKTKLIVNLTRGNTVCVGELADRPLARMRGLMWRGGLPAGEGLLLRPAPSIHTAFMRFPIDAVFLDRSLQVLTVVERLRPWRTASKRSARAVLELPAGESARRGVRVGDRLELRDRREHGLERGEPAANGTLDVGQWPASAPLIDGADQVRVARLRPLSVLIITPDHRFATVMSVLLARRNCSVTTTANGARASELIAREQAGVVIVDVDEPRLGAIVATAEALVPPVAVVLVAETFGQELLDRPAFAKWGPFEGLMQAIERADELRLEGVAQP